MNGLMNNILKRCIFFLVALVAFTAPFCVHADNFSRTVQKYRNFLNIPTEGPFLPIYMLIGVILVLLSFFKPKAAICVMLLFIMVSTDIQLDNNANSERGVTVRMEDIILLLVSGGWLLNRAKNRSLSIVKDVLINKGIIVMSVAMLISTLLGFFQGTVPMSRGILFTLKRLEYFWIFFMVLHIIDTGKEAAGILKLVLGVSVFVACFGIIQSILFPVSALSGGGATAMAGFGRANTLASFYLIMTGIFLGMLVYIEDRRKSIYFLVLLAILLLAIVLTKSRGAYVSLPPMFIAAYFICRRTKLLFFTISGLAVIGLFYLSTFLTGDKQILAKTHHEDIKGQFVSIGAVATKGPEADSSFNARYLAWKQGGPDIMKYPIFGHGVGAMKLGFFDNQYVHELYDTGIVGLLSLLYMNFVIFIALLNFFKYTNESFSRGLAMGLIAAQAGMLVHGMSITNFYTILNMEAFWLILALAMALYHSEKRERMASPQAVGQDA